jgi:site-specific DNA-cytosine methylase
MACVQQTHGDEIINLREHESRTMIKNQVLDLFCGLGGFSAAFHDSNRWSVTTVDIDARFEPTIEADVFDLRPSDINGDFDVVLASPPCTQFSTAGNHHAWDFTTHEPTTEAAKNAVGLVFHTLGLIRSLSPRYWFLENPQGRLRWFLGHPRGGGHLLPVRSSIHEADRSMG